MKHLKCMFGILAALMLTACVAPNDRSGTPDISHEQIQAETEAPRVTEKKLSAIISSGYGESSSVITFNYDDSGEMLGYREDNYDGQELLWSRTQHFVYDESGKLLEEKAEAEPYAAIEYLYDNETLSGYRKNAYWDMGDGEYQFDYSMEYGFEFDNDGNIIRQTTLTPQQEMWTNRDFFYDNEGRLITVSEDDRYGDHHFQNEYVLEYTYPTLVIVTVNQKLSEYESTNKEIRIKDFAHITVPSVTLFDGYAIVSDEDGYITSVVDDTGETVYRFEYE